MLGQRASRICAGAPASSQPVRGSSAVGAVEHLSPIVREAKWRQFALKLMLVLRSYVQKRALQAMLGKEVYARIFETTKKQEERMTADQHLVGDGRVINGEIVGRPLTAGGAKATVDPAICQHHSAAMKARANRSQKWWTCIDCQSRWDRRDMSIYEDQDPSASELILFGKYQGSEMASVRATDRNYCQWVLYTAEQENTKACPHLLRFATYLTMMEQREARETDQRYREAYEARQAAQRVNVPEHLQTPTILPYPPGHPSCDHYRIGDGTMTEYSLDRDSNAPMPEVDYNLVGGPQPLPPAPTR